MGPMTFLSIGDFARASGLTAKALRLYDELELVVPAKVDELNGYRWYAPEQLERARLVASLRLIGMPLYRIREVVGLGRSCPLPRDRGVLATGRGRPRLPPCRRLLSRRPAEIKGADDDEHPPAAGTSRSVTRHEQGRPQQPTRCRVRRQLGRRGRRRQSAVVTSAASTTITAVRALDQTRAADPRSAIEQALAQASAEIEAGDSTTLTALWFHGDHCTERAHW